MRAIQLALIVLLALVAGAAGAQQLKLNDNYRLIPQQPVATPGKIEVIDFFWYGCPFCNKIQPKLEEWRKKLPDDVVYRHIPVILKDTWAPHARIYYTLEALGEVERLHLSVYHSYHVDELYMSKPDVMLDWARQNGIDREKWRAAYNSPEVNEKIELAKKLTKTYSIQGTPTFVVNGRYLTSGGYFDDVMDALPVLDQLVKLAREQKK
ncbi:MAG TPA: thiol:disulfide interchange protein DsbA/DsbL [Burkholderiales bacterium]|nr:thiol:disulfide interchange protein DsbA/DsbL [Burkholderiales bacterium]